MVCWLSQNIVCLLFAVQVNPSQRRESLWISWIRLTGQVVLFMMSRSQQTSNHQLSLFYFNAELTCVDSFSGKSSRIEVRRLGVESGAGCTHRKKWGFGYGGRQNTKTASHIFRVWDAFSRDRCQKYGLKNQRGTHRIVHHNTCRRGYVQVSVLFLSHSYQH